jgi:Dihydrodipicolinate synthetase family
MLEEKLSTPNLPRGIVPLLETPFLENGSIDYNSLHKLVEHSITGGANGLTAPLVASEVQALSILEREQLVKAVAGAIRGRVPFIVGASADDAETCRSFAKLAEKVDAAAYLVAVPNALYGRTEELLSFFRSIVVASSAPVIIQDLQWNGPWFGFGQHPPLAGRTSQARRPQNRDCTGRGKVHKSSRDVRPRFVYFWRLGRSAID